jgi:hypothetical protein
MKKKKEKKTFFFNVSEGPSHAVGADGMAKASVNMK